MAVLRILERVLWGEGMMAAFLLVGGFFTVYLGFFALRRPGLVLKSTLGALKREQNTPGLSRFQALCTALAASVGTGNIVGVALMLTLGGSGSVFWMWAAALLSLSTGFAENVLGARYRIRAADGSPQGGPMYYIARGLGRPGLGKVWALACCLCALGMGCMVQSNSIAAALQAAFAVPLPVTALALTTLTAAAILGGAKRLGRVTEKLVPAMVVAYTLSAVCCLILRRQALPGALAEIFRGAFTVRAAGGFGLFAALKQGVGTGVFSNEAGLGSGVIANASAEADSPEQQGLWSIFEIGVDTLFMCTLTALVLLTCGVEGESGAALTIAAFSESLGSFGGGMVVVSLCLFAFSTTLGWSHYGAVAARCLFGEGGVSLFNLVFLAAVCVGAVTPVELSWLLANVCNGLMAAPNLYAILRLRAEVRIAARRLLKAGSPTPDAGSLRGSPRPGSGRNRGR